MYPWDIFTFPVTMSHHDAHRDFSQGRKLVSAGFVQLGDSGDGNYISAKPGSESLGVHWSAERQEQDTRILRMQFRY